MPRTQLCTCQMTQYSGVNVPFIKVHTGHKGIVLKKCFLPFLFIFPWEANVRTSSCVESMQHSYSQLLATVARVELQLQGTASNHFLKLLSITTHHAGLVEHLFPRNRNAAQALKFSGSTSTRESLIGFLLAGHLQLQCVGSCEVYSFRKAIPLNITCKVAVNNLCFTANAKKKLFRRVFMLALF